MNLLYWLVATYLPGLMVMWTGHTINVFFFLLCLAGQLQVTVKWFTRGEQLYSYYLHDGLNQ